MVNGEGEREKKLREEGRKGEKEMTTLPQLQSQFQLHFEGEGQTVNGEGSKSDEEKGDATLPQLQSQFQLHFGGEGQTVNGVPQLREEQKFRGRKGGTHS